MAEQSENGVLTTYCPVALLDSCPAYRRGLEAALTEAGFTVQEPDDVLRWASKGGERILAISLDGESDAEKLRRFASAGLKAQLLALLRETTASAYLDALRLGACGVIGRDDPLIDIVEAVRAALRGRTVLPKRIAFEVAATNGNGSGSATANLSDQDRNWIRALAGGATVAELADQVGYSERELYRLLKRLYARLGVEKRSEALVRAGTLGLVDLDPNLL